MECYNSSNALQPLESHLVDNGDVKDLGWRLLLTFASLGPPSSVPQ